MIRGKKKAREKKSPPSFKLKITKTSQLVKLQHLLQNSDKREATCQYHRKRRKRDEERKAR